MLRSSHFAERAIGELGRDDAVAVLGVRVAGVGAQSETGSLEDFLGVDDGLVEGVDGRIRGPGDAGGFLLSAELDDVAIEPDTVELGFGHVAGTSDAASAGGRSAEAVERLSHVPFSRGVEEGEFITRLDALGAN